MTARSAPELPAGTRLVADESLRRVGDGRSVLGGSPLRLLRLSAGGARALDRWLAGSPVAAGPAARLARRLVDAGLVHPDPVGSGASAVTLVVPVKDDPAGLGRVLASTQDVPERIVVDDGSRDPVPGAAVRHPRARGPAAARNSGWRLARTPLVVFLDADAEPAAGWLDVALRHFDDPGVLAVAPRIRSAAGGSSLDRFEADRSGLDMGPRPAPVRAMSRVSYVPSAALVVRRDALQRLGGFDEAMRFGEDVDLVWRLLDSGGAVRYEPGSVVRHRPRADLRSWLRQRYQYGTSAAPLSRRHRGLLSCARMSAWSAASWALLACGRPRAALVLAAASAGLLPRKLRGKGVPAAESLRLAGLGHLGAGRLLADAVRRAWWPLVLPVALVSRRARLVLLAAVLPCLVEVVRAEHGGASWFALRVLDDLAYSAGVWAGCARERTAAPLLPQFTEGSLR